ncbi:MAG: NAD-dependent epimerase/dehydratase family protein [Planctomycetota bacterium]
MKAFVTGGSGFVGRNLIAALRGRGDHVVALARSTTAAAACRDAGASEVIRGDLGDVPAMAKGMTGCDVVFHSAAIVTDWGDRKTFFAVNVAGTKNALAAAQAAAAPRFVHVGTEAALVGGPPIRQVDETRPLPEKPVGWYATTKGLAEAAVLAANREGFTTVAIRPRLIWGAGDTSLLPQIIDSVRDGRFRWIDGGRYMTSTCHVANVVEGVLLAAEKGVGGNCYFLTDGEPVEFRSFLTSLLATQGIDPGPRSLPLWMARAAARSIEALWRGLGIRATPPLTRTAVLVLGREVTVVDAKARRELGYVGSVSVATGLSAMATGPRPPRRRAQALDSTCRALTAEG